MLNNHEMTRVLLAERQATLRHEARRHHLLWGRRTTRRRKVDDVSHRPAPVDRAAGEHAAA